GRIRVAGEEVARRHDHAGRAEAALEAVLRPEPFLEGVERAVRGLHALDRPDVRAIRLDGEHRAALHRLAVDRDGARTALAGVAADVGAGELQVLAQELDEHPSGLDIPLSWLSVDDERDVLDHVRSLLPRIRIGGRPTGPRPMRESGPLSVLPGNRSMVNRSPIGCKTVARNGAEPGTAT